MGYDLHITRADQWSENEGQEISHEEWLKYVGSDPELKSDPQNPDNDFFVWTGDPEYQEHLLQWSSGNISSKYPVKPLVDKMIQIAGRLNAKVQGDDGEIYENSDGIPASYEEQEAQVRSFAAGQRSAGTLNVGNVVAQETKTFFSSGFFKYIIVPFWLLMAGLIAYVLLK